VHVFRQPIVASFGRVRVGQEPRLKMLSKLLTVGPFEVLDFLLRMTALPNCVRHGKSIRSARSCSLFHNLVIRQAPCQLPK
jgi:hypothetical protein